MARLPIFIQVIDRSACASQTETTKNRSYSAWIWILTFMSYLCYHMCRKPISVVHSQLHPDNCTALNDSLPDCWPPFDGDNYLDLFSAVDASWLWAYAIGMFISGYIADRVDLRLFLGLGMILSAAACAMFGFGYYFGRDGVGLWYYVLAMILSGLLQTTGWPSVVAALGNWFGKGNRGLIMGIWNSHTSFGNIAGTTLAGLFVATNWGLSFIVPAIIMASIGVLVLMFMIPEPALVNLPNPNKVERVETSPSPSRRSVSRSTDEESEPLLDSQEPAVNMIQPSSEDTDKAISIFAALKIPGVVEFSLCLFFAKLVAYTFLFWLPMYIKHSTYYIHETNVALATSLTVRGSVGGILVGTANPLGVTTANTCCGVYVCGFHMHSCFCTMETTSATVEYLRIEITNLFADPHTLILSNVTSGLTHYTLYSWSAKSLVIGTMSALIMRAGAAGAAVKLLITDLLKEMHISYFLFMIL
ncbi:unnamed protein product, partial [Meganyctiphanes norvegica]